MIVFVLKSICCLSLFVLFYKVFLEQENIHHFKRFYLLTALVLSITLPFIALSHHTLWNINLIQDLNGTNQHTESLTGFHYYKHILFDFLVQSKSSILVIYILITFFFLTKFIYNLITLKRIVQHADSIKKDNFTLVLLKEKVIPYSFLSYIFLNKNDFKNNKIEQELIWHEQTHISQKHSLDILLIEISQIFLWFNPALYKLKRAIKLNHEFLADQFVLKKQNNIAAYQLLLLNKTKIFNNSPLVSLLNYGMTKKRMLMMGKENHIGLQFFKQIVVLMLLILSVLLFTDNSISSEHEEKEHYFLSDYHHD